MIRREAIQKTANKRIATKGRRSKSQPQGTRICTKTTGEQATSQGLLGIKKQGGMLVAGGLRKARRRGRWAGNWWRARRWRLMGIRPSYGPSLQLGRAKVCVRCGLVWPWNVAEWETIKVPLWCGSGETVPRYEAPQSVVGCEPPFRFVYSGAARIIFGS